MALNQEKCISDYVKAMLESVKREEEEDKKAKKSDEPEAPLPSISDEARRKHLQKTMMPFGEAFYTIITKQAETFSNRNADRAFWTWVDAVQAWLEQQQKVNDALKQWIANSQQANKTALLNELNKVRPIPQKTPTELKGKIQ